MEEINNKRKAVFVWLFAIIGQIDQTNYHGNNWFPQSLPELLLDIFFIGCGLYAFYLFGKK